MNRALTNGRPIPSWVWYALLLLAALALPFFGFMDASRTSVAVFAGIYVILGLSLNIIVGYAGLFQLGHAAFFGLGAYTAAILSLNAGVSVLLTIPLAMLVAGGAAVLVSKPVLHLRGDYLCIVTIAFGEIFRIAVVNNIFGITGGSNGLFGTGRPELLVPWVEPIPFLFLVVALAIYAVGARKRGRAVQVAGGAILAVAYYAPPLLLGQPALSLVSMVMVIVALGVASALRNRNADAQRELIGVAVVAALFAVAMFVGGASLAGTVETALAENFNVGDPIAGPLGLTLVPFAFKRDPRPYYFLVLAFIVITIVGIRRLQDSRLGRAWLYVREDELAAEAMGIHTTRVKLVAFAIGSAWAGVAGVLYASRFTVIAPESFNFLQSVIMFCIVVLGGSGSIPGVMVGTLGMVVLPELLRDADPTQVWSNAVPAVILALILAGYLYASRRRLSRAAIDSALIAVAFFLPPLLLGQPPLYVAGIIMALVAVIAARAAYARDINVLPWLGGALAVYVVALMIAGAAFAAQLESVIAGFNIIDWRDGLMGGAMVLMMILRPAGIIPERRRGAVISAVAATPEPESAVAPQIA
ncbi:MAG: branched-chain amino acid ABC transporter permease [Anaerolineae bacterium]|nr:branched-chain amino acid ABC transporter permease [Anaerolineae bacterium]